MPDADRERYLHQAHREGMTFSAWLRAAAEERLAKQKQQQTKRFESVEELWAFFKSATSGQDRAGSLIGRRPSG
jgi:hypothetical protein